MFGIISPQNKITAENSAIHYSLSSYAYVLNNPLIYNDPLGLDSNKTNTIQEVTVYGYSSSGLPHWLGPTMIASGQPMVFLKPVGALGSQPGSSIASWTLSKVFPQNIPALKKAERKVIAMISKKAAKKAETAVLKRFLGRLVPSIGWGLTTYDVIDNKEVISVGLKSFSEGGGVYYKLRSDPKTFYMYAR